MTYVFFCFIEFIDIDFILIYDYVKCSSSRFAMFKSETNWNEIISINVSTDKVVKINRIGIVIIPIFVSFNYNSALCGRCKNR